MPTLESVAAGPIGNSGTTLSVDYPATVNSGDVLYLYAWRKTNASAHTFTTPSGWTLVGGDTATWNCSHALYRKTADGTETGTLNVTTSADLGSGQAGRLAIARVSSTAGHDQSAGARGEIATAAYDAPTITPTENGCLVLTFIGFNQPNATQPNPTQPSGHTEDLTSYEAWTLNLGASSFTQTTAGATGAMSWTTLTEGPAAAFSVSVLPAAASAATLSSPTSASVTQTGATIGATTDDATGTLYGVVTTSASAPSATQIKAGQDHTGSAAAGSGSNASLSVGANTIAITGLTAATTYYYYLVQDNGADSNVVNGTFATAVNYPTLTSPTAVSIGTTTVTPRVTTDTGNGTCYYVITPQAEGEPSNTQVEAGTNAADGSPVASGSQLVSSAGVITFSEVTGLTAGTAYRISYAHSGTPS